MQPSGLQALLLSWLHEREQSNNVHRLQPRVRHGRSRASHEEEQLNNCDSTLLKIRNNLQKLPSLSSPIKQTNRLANGNK